MYTGINSLALQNLVHNLWTILVEAGFIVMLYGQKKIHMYPLASEALH